MKDQQNVYDKEHYQNYLLYNNRALYLQTIDKYSVTEVISKLQYLQSVSDEDIHIYITGRAGEVVPAIMLCDYIATMKCNVHTYAMSMCTLAEAMVLGAGTRGKRHVLYHTSLFFYPVESQHIPLFIDKEITETFSNICISLLSRYTGISTGEVRNMIESKLQFFGDEIINIGLADIMDSPDSNFHM